MKRAKKERRKGPQMLIEEKMLKKEGKTQPFPYSPSLPFPIYQGAR
jgi:hypothetical protein